MNKLQAGDRVAGTEGLITVHRVYDDHKQLVFSQPNQIQYDWGYVAAQCIGKGNTAFCPSAIYIEYDNVPTPDTTITLPTYGRDEGFEYYSNLAVSGSRDFLRMFTLFGADIGVSSGYASYFNNGAGNQLTYFVQSQGTVGYNGKPFSSAANSKVYGVALVATPVPSDPTQDVIFARSYFASGDQVVKEVSGQIGITWQIQFL